MVLSNGLIYWMVGWHGGGGTLKSINTWAHLPLVAMEISEEVSVNCLLAKCPGSLNDAPLHC